MGVVGYWCDWFVVGCVVVVGGVYVYCVCVVVVGVGGYYYDGWGFDVFVCVVFV